MRVFVTGGAGYIGSHTVKDLLREGFEVLIFDNFSTGRRELLVGGEVIEGDLHDREALDRAFHSNRIEAVIHFPSLIQEAEGEGVSTLSLGPSG